MLFLECAIHLKEGGGLRTNGSSPPGTRSDNGAGASARRMLHALAEGATDPVTLAALADQNLRATPAELHDGLGAPVSSPKCVHV